MVNTDEMILQNLAVKVLSLTFFLRDGRYEDAVAMDEECMQLALFLATDEARGMADQMLEKTDVLLMNSGIEISGLSYKR